MRVILSEDGLPSPVPSAFFEDLAKGAGMTEGVTAPFSLALMLTDDRCIQEINRAWRHVDKATDVLSFPAMSFHPQRTMGQCSILPADAWDSETGTYFLGDIVISLPRVSAQAKAFGHGTNWELAYLFVHGVLHLMGYDHLDPEDKLRMREKEEKILKNAYPAHRSLLQKAREAREYAYTPYSSYKVGAALLGKSGRVYTGCNIENASFGLTNCAERTAMFKAISEGETEFEAIAIAADATPPWPCGACRQVLSEFAPKMRVLITWDDGRQADETTLDQLLPRSFLSFEEDRK
ncbi:MAG: cytidine deaminase [Christensenellales bacterium]|jgi:cytidine deaminase